MVSKRHLYTHVHSIVHDRPKCPSLDESWLETQHLKNWGHDVRSYHFMADGREKSGNSDRFIFLGSKITVDRDCSHEIKRCLLFGRKAMTNLDSILKSRDITLLTEVCIVKAIAFPGIMYSCENWTIKKAECWRIDAFKLWFLSLLWTARRSNQTIQKEISPEYSLEGLLLKLKLQYFGHLMWRTNSLEKTLMLGKIEGKSKGNNRIWDA